MKLSCFNLRFSSWQHKQSCKIPMVEKETLDGGPKGGGKEELGERE